MTRGRVFVVDDDRQILTALARLLGAEGFDVETFESPSAFLAQHDKEMPGCAVLDVGMEDIDGLALQKALEASGADRPIIFLTGCDDVHTGVEAMKSGAVDYLTKPVRDVDLIAAISRAIDFDRRQRKEREKLEAARALYATLTPREREVLDHVVDGKLNKQVAFALGTVEKTVKVHRAHIMQKMQVRSLAELVQVIDYLRAASRRPLR